MGEQGHYSEQEFEALVSSALDELPIEFQRALEHVAIVVSDRGAENHAYGMYVGSKRGGMPFFGGGESWPPAVAFAPEDGGPASLTMEAKRP